MWGGEGADGDAACPAEVDGLDLAVGEQSLRLTALWRLATRMDVGLASAYARPQPTRVLAVVIVAG